MTSNKLFFKLAVCTLASSVLIACQVNMGGFTPLPYPGPIYSGPTYSGSPYSGSPYTGSPYTGSQPAAAALTATPYDQMPESARRISAAVDGQIASQPPVRFPGVAFSTVAGQSNILPWLRNEGFVLTGSSLYRHNDVGAAGLSQTAGRLDYIDSLGRRAGFLWAANHRMTGDNRVIERLEIAPAFELRPRVHLALIPTAALPGGTLPPIASYADLASVVAQYSVSPSEVPASKAEYLIVLSSLDPISTTAKLDLRISSKGSGLDGYDRGAAHALISNWGVTVLRGTLDLANHPDLYAKAVFTPGREAGQWQRTPTLVGAFSLRPGRPGA
jgi:hypothetical protein